jgi:hypothetical protein
MRTMVVGVPLPRNSSAALRAPRPREIVDPTYRGFTNLNVIRSLSPIAR